MLTKSVIDSLYRKYDRRPASPDELDIVLLFEELFDMHEVSIDENGNLIISSIDSESPFHSIPLRNIHAIVNFEEEVAIVLHSSIIILEKHSPKVFINLRETGRTITDKIASLFGIA